MFALNGNNTENKFSSRAMCIIKQKKKGKLKITNSTMSFAYWATKIESMNAWQALRATENISHKVWESTSLCKRILDTCL